MNPKTQYQKMRDNRARRESVLASAREWTPVACSGNLEMSSVVLEDGSVLTASGPQSGQSAGYAPSLKSKENPLGLVRAEAISQNGAARELQDGSIVVDPHHELRKTWAPGQRWEQAAPGADDWYPCLSDKGPLWASWMQYRRCHDDLQDEAELSIAVSAASMRGELRPGLVWFKQGGQWVHSDMKKKP